MKRLSPRYLSAFCMELRLLLQADLEIGEGLNMLHGKRSDKTSKAIAEFLLKAGECKIPLSQALEEAGLFPSYLSDTVRLGEVSGKLNEALSSLASYYKRKARLSDCLRSAFFYPLLLFVVMSAVVIVVVTQVLPIFEEIYAQMGAQMSTFAVSLLRLGMWLSKAQAALLSGLAAFLVIGLSVYIIPPVRRTVSRGFGQSLGNKGVFGRISSTKFASAMSLAISSGLDPAQAIFHAENVCRNSYGILKKTSACRESLSNGESLELCLAKSNIFSGLDSRLLSLGKFGGRAAEVLEEIARRSEDRIVGELEAKLIKLVPTFIIATSFIVGLTLVSVMIPLVAILSSLG